jgi:hypothetical protein
VASSRSWTTSYHFHLSDSEPRGRSAAIVLSIKLELVKIAAVLAFLTFSELASENIDVRMDQSHGAADFGLKASYNIGDGLPESSLKVNQPKVIEHGFIGRGSAIDKNVARR